MTKLEFCNGHTKWLPSHLEFISGDNFGHMAHFQLHLLVFTPKFASVQQPVAELLHFEVKFNMVDADILDFVGMKM